MEKDVEYEKLISAATAGLCGAILTTRKALLLKGITGNKARPIIHSVIFDATIQFTKLMEE